MTQNATFVPQTEQEFSQMRFNVKEIRERLKSSGVDVGYLDVCIDSQEWELCFNSIQYLILHLQTITEDIFNYYTIISPHFVANFEFYKTEFPEMLEDHSAIVKLADSD